ncbi:MAG: hypothetical protein KC416_15240, partial [Myxococcales bacterium]|nr:hypothetical protein [Myxococcales bacterium]
KPLEEATQRLLAAPPLDFADWAEGAQRALACAASVVADDLASSVELYRMTQRDLAHRRGEELVRRSPTVLQMLLFWVSEEAMAARIRGGLFPSAAPSVDIPPGAP